MGEVRINVTNFIAIGGMAFAFVWLANRALATAGKPQFRT